MAHKRAPVGVDLFPRRGYKSADNPNSIGHRFNNLVSREISGVTWQVATYLDSNSRGVVCVRQLPFGAWTLYDVGSSYLTEDDNHNTFVTAIDADGYLHFAYDHHNDALNYRRSDAPLATWTGGVTATMSMLGTNESSVAYPNFIVAPTGEMYFHFRDGISGAGNSYLYVYDEATTSWSAAPGTGTAGLFLDLSPNYNFYPNRPWVFSSDWDGAGTGFMLITGTMRRTADGDTNSNIYLLKYTGTGFTDFAGNAQTIPGTRANMTAIQTIAEAEYLVNDCGQCLDSSNVPHLSYFKHDASDYHQLYHLTHNGTSWVETQLTSWTGATVGTERGRPTMACDLATDTVYVWYAGVAAVAENAEGLYEFASDPGDFTTWTKRSFYAGDMHAYEPQYDQQLWASHGVVSQLITHGKKTGAPDEAPRIVTRAPAAVSTAFVSADWPRKQPITVSALASGSVTGFSILLRRVHFADEVCSPTNANRAQEDGGDLRFFSDISLTTQLPCSVIKFGYDSVDGAGDADIQIRVGGLSLTTASKTIYCAYGNSAVVQPFVTDTYGAQAAMPSDLARYYPLQRNSTDVMDENEYRQRVVDGNSITYDSTGATFDPADTAPISLGTQALGVSTSFAVAATINVAASLSDEGQILSADNNSTTRVLHFRVRNIASPIGGLTFLRFNSSNASLGAVVGTTDLRGAGTVRVVGQWDSTVGEAIYVSGTLEGSSTNTTAGQDPTAADWYIGGRRAASYDDLFDGSIGHLELHSSARSAAWWAADALMHESPASFATAGTPVANPGNEYVMPAAAGAFDFAGYAAELTYTQSGDYTIIADVGSFALTGRNATLAYSGETIGSRDLTAATRAAIQASVTAPRLLIYIGWSSPVRVCTRETVTWSGSIWTGPLGRVDGITGASTDQRARIILPNLDDSYGAIALSSGLHDVPVRIYALYGSEPFAVADAVQLFEGQTDGGRITTSLVEVECIAMRQATIYAPRVYAQPPLMNHNPPAGTVLRWNGDIYTLERR